MWTYKNNRPKRVQWFRYDSLEDVEFAKERFIKNKEERLKAREEWKAKRKIEQKAKKEILRNSYKVWDLFSYSRGYDQTNVEYYQITEKRGAKVYIKAVWGKTTSIDSYDSQHSSIVKDNFLKDWEWGTQKNWWKVIWAYWISMDFWTLSPTNEKAEHFSSSRA